MAPKKSKKNSKSPGVTGTKPKKSQPSLQLPSTSASEVPMVPNPVLKAEKKALKKKDRLKRKTVSYYKYYKAEYLQIIFCFAI